MKQHLIAASIAAGFLLSAGPAAAEKSAKRTYEPSIQYYGTAKKYDAKIAAAAIEIVAGKIGDLRGSLEGFEDRFLIDEKSYGKDQSSHLGFPVMKQRLTNDPMQTGSLNKIL